jgi:predicted nucleic acid-binding protein
MLVVADSSALVALAVCDALPLLDGLFQEVKVPPAVFRECAVHGKPAAEVLEAYLQDKVVAVDLSTFAIAALDLGRGELEAMALCKRIGADRLLVDDRRARHIARLNAIEVIGSLGVLVMAKREGFVPVIRPHIHAIRSAGIRLGERIVAEALLLAGEAS